MVWCATAPCGGSYVVGWYKNATVYREYQTIRTYPRFPYSIERWANIVAEEKDCVLLTPSERIVPKWKVPRRQKGSIEKFGFYLAHIWYAREPEAKDFVERIIDRISSNKVFTAFAI